MYQYLKSTYGKTTRMAELDPNGIVPEMCKEFDNTYKGIQKDLDSMLENNQILDDLKNGNPIHDAVSKIFLTSRYCNNLSGLLSNKTLSKVPTSTCVPFTRSAHITVNGKIFLCERTGHDNCLGNFSECADLDFQNVADIINKRFDDLKNQCTSCYMVNWCSQCAMVLDSVKGEIKCPDFMNYQETAGFMSEIFAFFEKNPHVYPETMLKY